LHNYRFLCPNGLFLNNKCEVCEKCKKGNFFYATLGKCYRNSYIQSFILSITLWIHSLLGTFKKVDVYISPTDFLKSKMVDGGFPVRKIVVVPHFINVNELTPSNDYNNCAVFMGRIAKEKGIFVLVNAIKEISEICLEIIGNGPLDLELRDFVEKNRINNIEFSGYIGTAKRFDILKKAMFLVFPTECYESFPYVLIESFSLGIPVIASRVGGLHEIIEEGENGLFFKPGNTKELIDKMLILIRNRDLLLSMRIKARERAERKYSEEQGYKKLIKIYNRLLLDNNF
jgi:glycosyltransferase involved in cell wall biosynthesis